MGSLILCHDRHAAHPYEITRIHCRIFTIEELCYYLCNNLYLIDYTIMNEQLCTWLDDELGMNSLAEGLRDVLRLHGSVEKFVLTILKASRIYREPEMIRIQNVLEHLKNQKDIERQKYKGDNLLESGEVDSIVIECYVDDIRSIRISIRNNNIQNRIEYSGYCKFGWEDMQIYGEEFREIVLSDPFYTETLYSYFLEDEQMASWEFNFEGSGLGEKNEE